MGDLNVNGYKTDGDRRLIIDADTFLPVLGPLTDLELRATPVNVYIYGKTGDSTYQVPRIDVATHALNEITYEHHEIHSGDSFTVCHSADVGNGANMDVMFTTPNTTRWAHMTYEFECELEADFGLYEAPSASGGTPLVIYNRNRNSSTTATCQASHTPTVTDAGTTRLRCWHIGGGRSFGGGERGTHEFILKQNTKYLLRITNATANNNYMAIKIDFYEHTDKSA